MKYFTRSELTALLIAARKHSERNYLMILVSYWHGLRISETLALTAKDLRDGEITVKRLKGSLKTTQPLIAHPDPLYNERVQLERVAPHATGPLFKVSAFGFNKALHKYGREIGIAASKCHAHALKHSAAMHAIESGIQIHDLQRYLGHKSLNSTGAYLKVSDEKASRAFGAAMGTA